MKRIINKTNHNWYVKSEYNGFFYDAYGNILPKSFIQDLDDYKIEFNQEQQYYILRFYKIKVEEREEQIIISQNLVGSYLYNRIEKKFIVEIPFDELININFKNYKNLVIFIISVLLNEINSEDLLIGNSIISKWTYQFKIILNWMEYGQLSLITNLINKKYYGTLQTLLLYSFCETHFEKRYNEKFMKITEYMESNFDILYEFMYRTYNIDGIIELVKNYSEEEIVTILDLTNYLLSIKSNSSPNEIANIYIHLADIKKILPHTDLKENIKYIFKNISDEKLKEFPVLYFNRVLQYWIDYVLIMHPKNPYKENIINAYKAEIRDLKRVPIDFELDYHKILPNYKKYREKDGIYEIFIPDSLVYLKESDRRTNRDDYQKMIRVNNNKSIIALFKKNDEILSYILINKNHTISFEWREKEKLEKEDLEPVERWKRKHNL